MDSIDGSIFPDSYLLMLVLGIPVLLAISVCLIPISFLYDFSRIGNISLYMLSPLCECNYSTFD